MKRKYHRVGFTAAQSADLWERWKKGEGLKSIGRVLGKSSSSIFSHLSPSGGIRPLARLLFDLNQSRRSDFSESNWLAFWWRTG